MDTYPYLLSPLRDAKDHTFKGAKEFGKWMPLDGTLGELSHALDIDATKPVDTVRSTPDPWSQARSFADALRRPERNSATIAQWRGLLAILALAGYYDSHYQVDFQPVDLNASTSRFARVMKRLVPEAALPAAPDKISQGWDRPILVRVREPGARSGTAIGMLNPASLIAGGRDLDRLDLRVVPWWTSKGLQDPTTLTGADALPPEALLILRRFLTDLRDGLARVCAAEPENKLLGQVRKALSEYAELCAAGIGAFDETLTDADPADGKLPPLYALLQRTRRLAEPAPGRSDCLLTLRTDIGANLPIKGMVLFDPSFPATLGRPANAITLWGRRTLADAINNPRALADARARMAEAGYLLVRPDDLFTQVLVKLDERDQPARIAAHPLSLDDCLLPLSPLALLLIDPASLLGKQPELRDVVTLNSNGQVRLKLLIGGTAHFVLRQFTDQPAAGEGRVLDEVDWGLGDVAIWPNFTATGWSRYCARLDYATNSVGRLRGRFALSGRLLVDLLGEKEGAVEQLATWSNGAPLTEGGLDRVRAFAERSFIGPSLTRFRASNSGARAAEVQVASVPFEAVFFTILPSPDSAPVPAGLSLLSIPAVAQNPSDPAGTVAIDFGTTNTVACLDGEAPVTLEPRIVHPLEPARGGMRTADLVQRFRDFLPVDTRALPTPTVTIRRDTDAEGRQELDRRSEINSKLDDKLLVSQLVYFQPDLGDDGAIASIPLREWSSLLNRIQYNLKWSDDPAIKDAAQRYLRQLMMMIAAEWASRGNDPAKLNWYFSRPDRNDLQSFTGLLETALHDVVPDAPEDAIKPIVLEADAAAFHILNKPLTNEATRRRLNVILDIGGGTTDIAIRNSEGEALGSLSLRVAGGDFFTDHIMANPAILSDFGLQSWAGVVQQMAGESDAALKANIRYVGELLFSGRTLNTAIDRTWNRVSGTAPVRALKETAYLFLGGVSWYVGKTVGELIRTGKAKPEDLHDISVALCGRGAGLFKRLHGGNPLAETDVSNILLLIAVAAGEQEPEPVQVQFSDHPKIEVAAGMINMSKSGAADQALARPKAPRKTFGPGARGDRGSATGSEPVAHTRYVLQVGEEEREPFLEAFGIAAPFIVTLTDHQRAKLTNGIQDIDREDKQAKRSEQPAFAALLKVLVGMIRTPAGNAIRPVTQWYS